MPLINQNIQKLLRDSGIKTPSNFIQPGEVSLNSNLEETREDSNLEAKLRAAGLSLEEVLSDLSLLARQSPSEGIRLRALENALRAHGVNKEQAPPLPTINIIIQDPRGPIRENNFCNTGVNPILIPRKLQKLMTVEEEETTETI